MFKLFVNWAKKFKGTSGYWKWLVIYSKPYLPSLILLMFINSASSAISVSTAVIGQQMIDSATNGEPFKNKVLLYIFVVVAVQLVSIVSSLLSVMINEKFSFGIRKQVYDKILNTTYTKIQAYHTGDLMTRFTSDCGNIANGIATIIPSILTLITEFTITFVVLFRYDSMFALFAALIAPLGALISFWLGSKLKGLQIKVQESEAKYRSFIQESLSNILIIKTFCHEKYSSDRLTELKNERFHWIFKKTKLSLYASSAIGLGFQFGYIFAFAWGVTKLSVKTITYGTMSVFLTLVNRIQAPILGLANTIPSIVSVLASTGRVIELQELPVENTLDAPIEGNQIGVCIDHLTFGYNDDTLLNNACLNIYPNEFVAIVGESGIGKTTLIRLIMSFLQVNSGSITFVNDLGETQLANRNSREFLSYVPQGNTLFSGTIRSNLLMAKRDATESELIAALEAASAYEFINELPQGMDTVIGERGYGISEGQAQRISIARALIKNAPFLILDEATSSLDEATELSVLQGIRNVTPRPTCLLITHRRSVLSYCDREIKIEDAKLSEIPL